MNRRSSARVWQRVPCRVSGQRLIAACRAWTRCSRIGERIHSGVSAKLSLEHWGAAPTVITAHGTTGATGVSRPTRTMRVKEMGRSVRSAPQCALIENGSYFWCEQATSYWETLFGLPEFCGC